jgi:hypothetical protein
VSDGGNGREREAVTVFHGRDFSVRLDGKRGPDVPRRGVVFGARGQGRARAGVSEGDERICQWLHFRIGHARSKQGEGTDPTEQTARAAGDEGGSVGKKQKAQRARPDRGWPSAERSALAPLPHGRRRQGKTGWGTSGMLSPDRMLPPQHPERPPFPREGTCRVARIAVTGWPHSVRSFTPSQGGGHRPR